MNVNLKNLKISSIIKYFFAGCIILGTNSVYYDKKFFEIAMIGSTILMLLYILSTKKYKNPTKNHLLFIFIYYIYVIFYGLMRGFPFRFVYSFLFLLPLFFVIFSCFNKNQFYEFLNIIKNLIVFLSVVSLFFYLFGSLLGIIKENCIIYSTWSSNPSYNGYYFLHFNTQKESIYNILFIRNSGIFNEAPMFSLVLTIGLGIELFLNNEKTRFKRIFIFILTIFTTLSTTGIVISMLMVLSSFIIIKSNKSYKQFLKIILIPILLVFAYNFASYLLNNKIGGHSYNIRIDDFKAAYKAWCDNPIFGVGLSNKNKLLQYISSFRKYNTGFSNSILTLLAEGGIYLFLIYFIPYVRILFSTFKNNKKLNLFLLFYLLLFISTIFTYTPFALLFLAMFLNYINDVKKKAIEMKEADLI